MDWILVAVAAYFLNAVTPLIDKFLLGDHIPNPTVYAFYVGLLSIVAVIMAPFGLIWPGTAQFLFSLVSGALFLFGLYVFFIALKRQEASRVVPVVGAFTAVDASTAGRFDSEEAMLVEGPPFEREAGDKFGDNTWKWHVKKGTESQPGDST